MRFCFLLYLWFATTFVTFTLLDSSIPTTVAGLFAAMSVIAFGLFTAQTPFGIHIRQITERYLDYL
jgi:hypothetical protein